jgi:hypothetical protein
MIWIETDGEWSAHAQGIVFTLQPTDWSIWSIDQAKASAAHIANLKQCGLNPWVPGCQVKLFYRADEAPVPPLKLTKGGYHGRTE